MRVARLVLTDDLAIKHIERGEQRGAVAFVIERHRLSATLLQRQSRLRAIQRMHLAFLVAAQHQRMLGRRHVQTHDVFELLDELRVARDLEAPHAMGLQSVRAPVARDTGGAVPSSAAIVRALRWMAAAGLLCVVSSTSRAISTFDGGSWSELAG